MGETDQPDIRVLLERLEAKVYGDRTCLAIGELTGVRFSIHEVDKLWSDVQEAMGLPYRAPPGFGMKAAWHAERRAVIDAVLGEVHAGLAEGRAVPKGERWTAAEIETQLRAAFQVAAQKGKATG